MQVPTKMIMSACPGDTVAVLEAQTSLSTVRRDAGGRAALRQVMDSYIKCSQASLAMIFSLNM